MGAEAPENTKPENRMIPRIPPEAEKRERATPTDDDPAGVTTVPRDTPGPSDEGTRNPPQKTLIATHMR